MQIRCERTFRAFKWKFVRDLGRLWLCLSCRRSGQEGPAVADALRCQLFPAPGSSPLCCTSVVSVPSEAVPAMRSQTVVLPLKFSSLICWRHWCLFLSARPHVLSADRSNGDLRLGLNAAESQLCLISLEFISVHRWLQVFKICCYYAIITAVIAGKIK